MVDIYLVTYLLNIVSILISRY